MQSKRTICVVEDDPAIRRGLVDSLKFAGYTVLECADGPSARRTLGFADVDLVLLDVVLPDLDGERSHPHGVARGPSRFRVDRVGQRPERLPGHLDELAP